MKPNFLFNSNQLQNHPKFITVHGRWANGQTLQPLKSDWSCSPFFVVVFVRSVNCR